jgi:repressor LexA
MIVSVSAGGSAGRRLFFPQRSFHANSPAPREGEMPEPLSKPERRILDYIIEYLRQNTYQPSIREIGRRFDIKSTKTVSEHLEALADKGWIERDPARSRGVRILGVDLSPRTVSIPIFSEDELPPRKKEPEEGAAYELDRRLAGPSGTFFIIMPGESMQGAGICDGDLLLTEPVTLDDLDEGDIIAVRFDGELTVKRYTMRDGEVVLEPAHPDYVPVLLSQHGEYTLIGRMVALFRRVRPVPPLPPREEEPLLPGLYLEDEEAEPAAP